ncbi:MAG: patatin-like phospholipase family protein [Woeseiaceae bacterium]
MAALLLWLWMQVPLSAAQAADREPGAAERPRIGLVLAGGGARGAAHIGVLKVLEDMRVPVDCIAGTSMGALVGAVYAAGTPAREIETSVRGVDWSQTLGGQGLRDLMPIEKKLDVANYTNTLDIGITRKGLRGRGGLVATQGVEGLLDELVAQSQFTRDFDQLPIPYRAVATDILAGEMVVLDEGDLAVAMRASMAIPGVFSPVELDGKLLADGGLMRNLPVDVARDLCADVVIAVWMEVPQATADDVRSSIGMVDQMLSVMVGSNQKEQIESLTANDIGIAVPIGDIGTGQFNRAGEAIDVGETYANQYRSALSRYSVTEREYAAWTAELQREVETRYPLAAIEVVGTERVNPAYVESQLENVGPGATVTVDEIVRDTESIYALGDFERVQYRLTGPADARTLELQVREKSWGPNFLGFDYGISTGSSTDLQAILRLDHERTWLNRRGGRWHNGIQFGRQAFVTTDFYQPLDVEQRYFVQPMFMAENRLEDLYVDEDRAATYRISDVYGQIDFGLNLGTRLQMRLGFKHGWQSAKIETGIQGLPELDRLRDSSVQFRVAYDTRNVVALPTEGSFFALRYSHSEPWFSSDFDYSVVEAVLSQSFDLNGNSLSLILGGADTLSGETPASQLIELGGIQTFPGLRPGELRGSEYWFVGTSYSWRIAELVPLLGQALYAGFRVQAGEVSFGDESLDAGTLVGVSGSLSGRTPIGPVMLSLGWVDGRQVRLQFTLGRPVPEGSLLDELN